MRIELNTNAKCEVTLSAHGAQLFCKYHEDLKHPVTAFAGDTKRMPLWEAMHIFGPALYQGNPEIPFRENKLTIIGA